MIIYQCGGKDGLAKSRCGRWPSHLAAWPIKDMTLKECPGHDLWTSVIDSIRVTRENVPFLWSDNWSYCGSSLFAEDKECLLEIGFGLVVRGMVHHPSKEGHDNSFKCKSSFLLCFICPAWLWCLKLDASLCLFKWYLPLSKPFVTTICRMISCIAMCEELQSTRIENKADPIMATWYARGCELFSHLVSQCHIWGTFSRVVPQPVSLAWNSISAILGLCLRMLILLAL
jgi:hypothetical protein